MNTYTFSSLSHGSKRFFELLPEDWQTEIVPFWKNYGDKAQIYILEDGNNIIGGGIAFFQSPPNIEYFESEAKTYFAKGYHYLGFIWIAESHRKMNLGSFWLDQLKKTNGRQHYFLLTEEIHLRHFYEKNGFRLVKTVRHKDQLEWLFIL